MRKVLLAIVFILAFTSTAWAAATDIHFSGKRNEDGSTTLYWDGSTKYQSGTVMQSPGTVKLYADFGKGWFDTGVTVDFSRGQLTYPHSKASPDSTYRYCFKNVMGFVSGEVSVGKYTPPTQPSKDESEYGEGNSGNQESPGTMGPFSPGLFKTEPEIEGSGYIEKFLSQIFMIPARFVYHFIGINEPLEIVFNRDIDKGMAPLEDLHLNTFTDGEYQAIGIIYEKLRQFAPIPLVIGICAVGLLMLINSTNGNSRLTTRDYLMGILVCVLLLQFGHYLWEFVFGLNSYIVELFYSTIEGRIVGKGFIDTLCRWDTSNFGLAVIAFVAVVAIAILTWQYELRKIMLAILLVSLPIVAIAAVIPSRRGAFNLWLTELMANLFLQAGHAAAFALFLLFTANGASFWLLMAFLLGMNSVAALVRRVIGAESVGSGATGMAGTMLGLGSLMALGRMGGALMGGKMASPALGMIPGAEGVGGALATTSQGNILTSAAKGAAAVTTGLAGGALGGMALGNPGMGLMAGSMIGAGFGSKIGQLSDFIGNVSQEANQSGQSFLGTAANRLGIFSQGQLYDGQSAAQIGRNIMGGTGVLGGMGALGGHMVSGVARTAQGVKQAMPGLGGPSPSYQTGQALASFRQNVTQDMAKAQTALTNLTPQYQMAKLQLERAKSPEIYPDETARNLAIQDAQNHLNTIGGQIADSKLTIMDGNWALSNEGIQSKLEMLRNNPPPQNVYGGIGDFQWR